MVYGFAVFQALYSRHLKYLIKNNIEVKLISNVIFFSYICPDNIFIEPVQNTNVILNIDRIDFTSQKQSNLCIDQ